MTSLVIIGIDGTETRREVRQYLRHAGYETLLRELGGDFEHVRTFEHEGRECEAFQLSRKRFTEPPNPKAKEITGRECFGPVLLSLA